MFSLLLNTLNTLCISEFLYLKVECNNAFVECMTKTKCSHIFNLLLVVSYIQCPPSCIRLANQRNENSSQTQSAKRLSEICPGQGIKAV